MQDETKQLTTQQLQQMRRFAEYERDRQGDRIDRGGALRELTLIAHIEWQDKQIDELVAEKETFYGLLQSTQERNHYLAFKREQERAEKAEAALAEANKTVEATSASWVQALVKLMPTDEKDKLIFETGEALANEHKRVEELETQLAQKRSAFDDDWMQATIRLIPLSDKDRVITEYAKMITVMRNRIKELDKQVEAQAEVIKNLRNASGI